MRGALFAYNRRRFNGLSYNGKAKSVNALSDRAKRAPLRILAERCNCIAKFGHCRM